MRDKSKEQGLAGVGKESERILLSPFPSLLLLGVPPVVRKFDYTSNNPSSPNSDQHEFSPNTIRMLPREMVRRVYKMITKEKML